MRFFYLTILVLGLIGACDGGASSPLDQEVTGDDTSTDASDLSTDGPDAVIGDEDELIADDDGPVPQVVEGPTITLNDNDKAPLAAVGTLSTDIPSVVRVTITAGGESRIAEVPGDPAVEHRFPVLGLFPGVKNSIAVTVRAPDGPWAAAGAPVTVDAPALPDDLPPIDVTLNTPDRREQGWTLLNISHSTGTALVDFTYGCLIVALDMEGRVGWYFRDSGDCYGFGRFSDGRMFVQFTKRIIALDMLGTVSAAWHPVGEVSSYTFSVPIAVDDFHHVVTELPSGNIAILANERRDITDWPTSETDPDAPLADTGIRADEIVELTKEGTEVGRWKLFDILDPYRLGYTSIRMFKQWSHANGLLYDESDDSFIVSSRNQSVLLKLGRADGQLKWLLGPHDNWKEPWSDLLLAPAGEPFAWNYYQHGPMLRADGSVLVFDNGAYRAFPYEPMFPADENWSRAAIFSVDETARTVTQVWEWGSDIGEKIYAPYLGNAAELPVTGNVLVVFGGIIHGPDGKPTDDLLDCKVSARVIEVTRGEGASEKVFDLGIKDPDEGLQGWRIYRGDHWPSLYAGEQ
ncbi:MAG TPA: aryl-sulfate sulfotransferase [bacterium]|nr:aryl-sulfate sulfotransferase [bacterium]